MKAVARWCAAAAALLLSACAINLSSVKFQQTKPAPDARFPVLSAEQRVCEVERELALYVDAAQQLWLACPYRYEGRTIPLVAYIGPDVSKGAVEFTYGQATEKMKSMKKQALRKCGTSQYCADLGALGFMDFTVRLADKKAFVRYLDLSAGLKEVEDFYAGLGAEAPATAALDPQLRRLLEPARVVQRVDGLASLAQYRAAAGRIEAAGLGDNTRVRAALDARRTTLEVADFRQQGSFEGYQSAYRLTRERADLDAMQPLARTEAQRSGVFAALVGRYQGAERTPETLALADTFAATEGDRATLAELRRVAEEERQAALRREEEARQAALARQEQARLAEQRRQEAEQQAQARREEEARQAALRAQQARAEEQACLANAACRRAWEARREECTQKVMSCRAGCDRATGSGSYGSFIANLSAAALARACYAGCKCENGFGDLVNRFNVATTGVGDAPRATAPAPAVAAAAGPKAFECRIYCKSSTGPTITRRIEAASLKEAARIAGERANEFCAADGKSHASSKRLDESQCRAR